MTESGRSIHKLVLFPSRAHWAPESEGPVVAALTNLGVVDGEFAVAGQRHFYAGDRFLDHVMFLGCSPAVSLDPPEAVSPHAALGAFCHLQVIGPCSSVQYRADPEIRAPRCPSCRSPVSDWQRELQCRLEEDGRQGWHCPHCGHGAAVDQWDWRRQAALGRLFVDIWNIYPQEAVPGDGLLEALHQATAVPWTWAYTIHPPQSSHPLGYTC